MKKVSLQMKKIGAGLLAGAVLAPAGAHACACGCGVFDVGTSSMLPEGAGGMAYLSYAYQNQGQNWHGASSAPAENNDDKKIETDFVTAGVQYMFNRSWGMQVEVPYDYRQFRVRDDGGDIVSRNWSDLGDIRLKAIYTGFSEDLSAGVSLGVKLPTGSISRDSDVVDRDTQIGTGSTDLLLGGFYRHALIMGTPWQWFGQGELDVPTLVQASYRPGVELDAAAGIYYDSFSLGPMNISPIAQVIGSWRGSDSGNDADGDNTGYERILLSPGIEFNLHPVRLYADVEFPVYQNVIGNQVVAPALFKVSLSYMF